MSKKETDISLISKYLKGELDGRAMHQLEKRAQSDPFLMDAMSGYENAGNDQRLQLQELSKSLAQRASRKESRVIPWRYLSIAASILVIFTVGGLLWFHNPSEKKKGLVADISVPVAKKPVAIPGPAKEEDKLAASVPLKPAPLQKHVPVQNTTVRKATQAEANNASVADVTVAEPVASVNVTTKQVAATEKDTTPLNEMVVMGMSSAKKDKKASEDKTKLLAKRDTAPNTVLQANVPGVIVNRAEGVNAKNSPMAGNGAYLDLVQGRVLAGDNGLPVPGASVRLAGTNKIAITDEDGKFSLPVDSTRKNKLVIASMGYATREVNAKGTGKLKPIELEPTNNSLSEVVVVRTDSTKKAGSISAAHPVEGWDSMKKYLKDNAASPDGKSGTVKLSFMVDRLGAITDVKVVSSVSDLTDKKAVNLISNGPVWVGNVNGQPEKVTLKIKFSK